MEAPRTAPVSFSPARHSSWHTPVTYLFEGLAALLGLIFLSIFILSFTYLKLIDYLENRSRNVRSDPEAAATGDANGGSGGSGSLKLAQAQPVVEEKYLVVMAGQLKPTFLATPISSKASSNSTCSCSTSSENTETSEKESSKKKPRVLDV